MNGSCSACGAPYGQRKRCYLCTQAHRKTGEMRLCAMCGAAFYVPKWMARDTARNSGTYCSRACKGKVEATRERVWFKRDQAIRHSAGYLLEWAPDHPRAGKGGRVLQHILVAERMLGRSLAPDEHVHHKNLVRDDNRPENLAVMNKREHHQLHSAMMLAKRRAKAGD